MSIIRQDPTTKEWVIIAAERKRRPHEYNPKARPPSLSNQTGPCPFCPGNEAMTPEEVFRVAGPQGTGWAVRLTSNKFPALGVMGRLERREAGPLFREMDGVGVHEVIIETPSHERLLPLMTDYETADILRTYQVRYGSLRDDPRLKYIIIFKNHGEAAGTSLVHSHSQFGGHAGAVPYYECEAQSGGLHANEAFFLVEIQDVETGEYIEEPGRRGKMIITALDREAQPCVRFDSKDLIEWAAEPCPCGRTFRLIKGGVVGRSDDITKVKGVLLAPSAIEEVVRGIDGLSEEFEVIEDKVGDIDRIALKVEILGGREGERRRIETQLKDQLRLKTNLGYNIEFHKHGTLPRYEVKAKRFKDLRKGH